MADEIDPRLKAIMDKLNKSSEKKAQVELEELTQQQVGQKAPPSSFDQFLKAEKLDEWPYRLTSENILDLTEEKQVMGSIDDIKDELRNATMLDMTVLEDLETRLQQFEARINAVADLVIVDTGDVNGDSTPYPMSVSRAFLTEIKETDTMKVHPSRKKKKSDFKEETRQKTVEYCIFPGFRPGELTELPGQLEAPQILNRVTKVQQFTPGLKKFWKKIFQSEASVAMMQDAFWWLFIHNFERRKEAEKEGDKSQLFDRLADSFVALFNSINPEIKDKIFTMYADCLCQGIYIAFVEAFPESMRHFQEDFKQKLVNTVSEWITGIQPSYGSWSTWDVESLQLRSHKPVTDAVSTAQVNMVRDVSLIQPNAKRTLPMADFHRTMQLLGNPDRMATIVGMAANASTLASREGTKLTVTTPEGTMATGPVPTNTHIGQTVSPRKQPAEPQSSCMGRGAEVERVLFNLQGRSPLVAHYLHMRQLRDNRAQGRKVRRTQLLKPPPETKTYKDLIRETTEAQMKLSHEYNRICDMTHAEISKIEKQQRETTKRIDELQKSIANCKNGLEIKLLSERLMENSKDWDTGPLSSRQATEVKALMQKDKDECLNQMI